VRFLSRSLVCLLAALVVGGSAYAQVKRQNFTRNNSIFSPGSGDSFNKNVQPLKRADGFGGQVMDLKEWNKTFSPLGQRRAPFDVNDSFNSKMIEPEIQEFSLKDREISIMDGRQAHIESWGRMWDRKEVGKYANAPVASMDHGPRIEDMGNEPSLRDINRFQFRENRADGPIPVQRAGSGDLAGEQLSSDTLANSTGDGIADLVFGQRRSNRRTLDLGDPAAYQNFAAPAPRDERRTSVDSLLGRQKPKIDTSNMPKSFHLPGESGSANPFDKNVKVKKEGDTTISVRVKD